MGENIQRVCASILTVMVVILSLSDTKGNNDLAMAPMSEQGLLPNPLSCVADARKIPDCVEAVKQGIVKDIKQECCIILLGLPEVCFGILFPMRFYYRIILKMTCKLIGIF
ncbi:ECA1 gametogenesis related family protein [Arabidopsis thaliana]|uniref:ECA1 gametogenesis related family protein n=1 Tax=Arabidopsis thaliana TaxID=3702 RepID=A8MQM1_ARATH|nr:ECA1 gametogenesis related family protein [Arabidopsis thaliana]AEE77901.1 ECA1 gametogenesis related family protein [Arabidopsis thaliana]|eukprot:NP_001078235.1 ECA1 gametogenesis related family protein [Arabidopsis thaliana]